MIVSYNSSAYLPRLAESLRTCVNISTVTIVDNGSIDESVLRAENEDWGHPTRVLRRDSNPGFGSSMNFGTFSQETPHGQVLILNPDVLVTPEALESLSLHLDTNHALGAIGPVLRTSNGADVSSARKFPTPRSIAQRYVVNEDHDGILTFVDWICGASMLWRREAFEQLGGFSPDYFLYFEDVDICRRAKEAGWRIALDGGTSAIHDQGHGRRTSPFLRKQSRISRRRYAQKWFGAKGLASALTADSVDFAANLYHSVRGN